VLVTKRWALVWFIPGVAKTAASYRYEPVLSNHCLAALDLGAGVEQPFDCLIVQNRQAKQSMRRSMDWTLEDNMVDGLFFCTTLTGRRRGHTLLQPLRWCCVDCVIYHERDVREEQHYIYVARTSNNRVIVAWKLCRY